MTPDAIFWIASMTKPITATAVMMMQEEGKLSVDDPVSKYLPEFTGDKAGITIKQCLTHSSGLSDLKQEEVKNITTLAELMPPDRRQAVGVSARQQVAVLPDGHQHGGTDRRGRFRQDVSRFPASASVRSARHEGHQFLSRRGAASTHRAILQAHRRRGVGKSRICSSSTANRPRRRTAIRWRTAACFPPPPTMRNSRK